MEGVSSRRRKNPESNRSEKPEKVAVEEIQSQMRDGRKVDYIITL